MATIDDFISRLREEERRAMGEVRDREAKLEESERRLELIQAKLNGALEAKRLTDFERPKAPPKPKKRNRTLSDHWKKILSEVDQLELIAGGFDYDDLIAAAESVGHTTSRDNLRSQMSLYKSAGLVDATEDGKFRLTDAGRKAADVETDAGAQAPNETEAPSEAAGAPVVADPGAPTPGPAAWINPQSRWRS